MKKLMLLSFLFLSSLHAKDLTIQELSGDVFIKKNNKMVDANTELLVSTLDEVICTENGMITLRDHDNLYYLTSSTQVSLMNNFIELKSGVLRIRSRTTKEHFILTAQGLITHTGGDAIIIADTSTKLFVLDGSWFLAPKDQTDFKIAVSFGEFSKVTEDGTPPRMATRIGANSYKMLASLFDLKREEEPLKEERSIASSNTSLGSITYRYLVTAKSKPVNVDEFLKKEIKSITTKKVVAKTKPLPVTILEPKKIIPKALPPAMERTLSSVSNIDTDTKEFEDSLMKEYVRQMRYDNATRSLIQELENLKKK